jgi:hypothetical protein
VDGRDPFQVLYNRIANDLVRAREKRKPQELAEVREVARLRFAASMAPDPYAAYLAAGKKGRTRVERLPAADDPMIARISAIRDRDHMFVDTSTYYADFYARMDGPTTTGAAHRAGRARLDQPSPRSKVPRGSRCWEAS